MTQLLGISSLPDISSGMNTPTPVSDYIRKICKLSLWKRGLYTRGEDVQNRFSSWVFVAEQFERISECRHLRPIENTAPRFKAVRDIPRTQGLCERCMAG